MVMYLDDDRIRGLLRWDQLIAAMEEALADFSLGRVLQAVWNMLTIEEGKRYLGIMPAVAGDAMGAKLVSFYPQNAATGMPTISKAKYASGGSQALSRSLFSQLIPAGREGEYFGVYEISDRATSALGALMIFVTLQVTGSYRLAIAALVVFFVVGFAVLRRVDVARGIREVGNEVPDVV